jgi:hypothetical protein
MAGTRIRRTASIRDKFVACFLQGNERSICELFLDQHVICVERRNRKDGNATLRQRFDERQQHTGQRKRKRPVELQANPSMRRMHICGKILHWADDRKFLRRSRDGCEFAFRCPLRDGCVRRQTDDAVSSRELSKLEPGFHAPSLTFDHAETQKAHTQRLAACPRGRVSTKSGAALGRGERLNVV